MAGCKYVITRFDDSKSFVAASRSSLIQILWTWWAIRTCKVAMASTGFTAFLDPIPGGEPGQGLDGAGEGVDLPTQLCMSGALLPDDLSRVEGNEVLHEAAGGAVEDKDRGEVRQKTPLLWEGGWKEGDFTNCDWGLCKLLFHVAREQNANLHLIFQHWNLSAFLGTKLLPNCRVPERNQWHTISFSFTQSSCCLLTWWQCWWHWWGTSHTSPRFQCDQRRGLLERPRASCLGPCRAWRTLPRGWRHLSGLTGSHGESGSGQTSRSYTGCREKNGQNK